MAFLRICLILVGCIVAADGVKIELLEGRGQLVERDGNGNYDLKVFPGERITLLCDPGVKQVHGHEFKWRQEPSSVLYSSVDGVQELPESGPDISKISFEPRFPCRWDEVWRMTIVDVTEDDNAIFTCYSDTYGQATVDLTVTFAAVESAEMTFNDYGDVSADGTKVTVQFDDECNFNPSRGKWDQYGGDFCYQAGKDAVTFDEADSKCQELGSSLTSIHSIDERNFIRAMLPATGASSSWIGLTDREIERNFIYTDGTPLDYTDWSFFEPNDRGGTCVAMVGSDWWEWYDVSCDEQHRYLCKAAKGSGSASTSSMSVTCQFYGEHPTNMVTWYKDGQVLSGPSYVMEEQQSGRVHKLTILTGLESSGVYRCVDDNARNGSLTIEVKVAVNMTTTDDNHISVDGTDNNLIAGRGRNVTLTCAADTMTPEPTLRWRKEQLGEFTDITSETSRVILSQDHERKEWSITLLDMAEEDQGIYFCEMLAEPEGNVLGTSLVYITVFDASQDDFDIFLTENTVGTTRKLNEDNRISVYEGIGEITFTCRTPFRADTLEWRKDGRTLGSYDDTTVVQTVPGWELQITFSTRYSGGTYQCYAASEDNSRERTFELVTVRVFINVALTGGSGHEIQHTQGKIITVHRGESVSLTCSMKHPNEDIQYLRWEIGSGEDGSYPDTYFSPEYSVKYYHNAYGRLSFQEDRELGESTLTLTDVSEEDANVYICKILYDGDEVRIQLVVVDPEADPCEYECYPETGPWDGNCREAHEECDGEKNCANLQDEAECPDIGCPLLVAPLNGNIEVTSLVFGSEVTYHCADGYVLQGNDVRMCQDNGEWTGVTPSCEQLTLGGCPRLSKPENGLHFIISNDIGDINYFKCNNGYDLQGSTSRTCQEDGTWSGEDTVCQNIDNADAVNPRCRLTRGDGVSVDYPVNRNQEIIQYRTVITVDKDVGSITIACRFPSVTTAPYWLPKNNGYNEPPGPLLGDNSVSETIPGLEWSFTIGVSDEGPLLPGDQMSLRCSSSDSGTGYMRIDVRDDLPWATINTTNVAVSLTRGEGVENIIQHDNGSSVSHIQVTAGSKISLTCEVTVVESIASEHMSVSWKKQEYWGESSIEYSDDSRISVTEDLDTLEWTMTIRKIAESDTGVFICKGLVDSTVMFADEAIQGIVNLTVLPAPTTPMPTTVAPPTTIPPTESVFSASVRVSLKKGEGVMGPITDLEESLGTSRDISVLPDQTISLVCKVSNTGSYPPSDIIVTWQRLTENGVITVTRGSERILRDPKIRIKEDLKKLRWTLTLKDINSEFSGRWNCLVKPRQNSYEGLNIINAVINLEVNDLRTTAPPTDIADQGEIDMECYECYSSPFYPGPRNCYDPLGINEEGVTKVQCDGRCYANSTSTTFQGQVIDIVQRGCTTDITECPPLAMCQEAPGHPGTSICSYCCEGALCNSDGLQEAAEAVAVDSFNCWTCNVELMDGIDPAPMSCSSDDFNGEGAVAAPCQTQCIKIKSPPMAGQPASFTRSCDPGSFCSQLLPGFQIECCSGELCNVGGIAGSTVEVENANRN